MQSKPNYCLWDLRASIKEYLPKNPKLEEPYVNPHCLMGSHKQTKEDAAIRWKACLMQGATRIAVSATEPPQNQSHGCKIIAAVSATELHRNQTSLPNGEGKVHIRTARIKEQKRETLHVSNFQADWRRWLELFERPLDGGYHCIRNKVQARARGA